MKDYKRSTIEIQFHAGLMHSRALCNENLSKRKYSVFVKFLIFNPSHIEKVLDNNKQTELHNDVIR